MKPIFSARKRFSSAAVMVATLLPSIQIAPSVGWSRQPIRLTSVDLPEPDGPITASHSPGATERETSSSARTSTLLLYTLVTFLSSMGIILLGGSPRAVSVAAIGAAPWRRPAPAQRCPAGPESRAPAAAG